MPAAVTPQHVLSLTLLHLKATIDATPIWRALVESPDLEWADLAALADADESPTGAAAIHVGPQPGTPACPSAILRFSDDSDLRRYSASQLELQGELMFDIWVEAPAAYQAARDLPNANWWFLNLIGRLLEEMQAQIRESAAGLLYFDGLPLGPLGLVLPKETDTGRWRYAASLTAHATSEIG